MIFTFFCNNSAISPSLNANGISCTAGFGALLNSYILGDIQHRTDRACFCILIHSNHLQKQCPVFLLSYLLISAKPDRITPHPLPLSSPQQPLERYPPHPARLPPYGIRAQPERLYCEQPPLPDCLPPSLPSEAPIRVPRS